MECKEFPISIDDYLTELINFIETRFSSPQWADCIDIKFGNRRGNRFIKSVNVHIYDRTFKFYENSDYVIKITENPQLKSDKAIFVSRYSYEIKNLNNPDDFVRFDYKPYSNFPHFHINADEKKWGNHLTYPESTNINLEKLDCFTALEIFNAFVAHPEEHILDSTKNQRYIAKIKTW